MDEKTELWKQVLDDYELLEPDNSDSWNPLDSGQELAGRLSFYYGLREALSRVENPRESLRILDLGCGNGRSTRLYLEFGCQPHQLTGVDLREGAIRLARSLHPTIRFEVQSSDSLATQGRTFTFISINLVVSSIKDDDARASLAKHVFDLLEPGGYLFFFDLRKANSFAGGQRIHPRSLFSSFTPVWHRALRSYQFIPRSERSGEFLRDLRAIGQTQILRVMRERVGRLIHPTHEALLAKKAGSD